MKCIVVDDEIVQRAIVESYIKKTHDLELSGSFEDAKSTLEALEQGEIDILFLDIELPDMHGMELISLLKHPIQVILITAHSNFAIEAFDKAVTDYLVKPFSYERFLQAIEKTRKNLRTDHFQPIDDDATLFVKMGNEYVKLMVKNIQWVEAYGDYVKIILNGKPNLVLTTLGEMEKRLPANRFVRVHRSYIVAIPFISKVSGDILDISGNTIPVSRTYKPKLFKVLNLP